MDTPAGAPPVVTGDPVAPRRRGEELELIAGVAAAVASIVVVAWMSRDQWFLSDSWDFLTTREIGSVDDMLRPHAGHWQTPTAVAHRVLYGVFGMDYWPWWDVPRLLGHAALSFVTWRVLLWRGTDRRLAFAVYLVLLVSGVSDWHRIATIGNFIVWPALLGVAVLVAARPRPSWRDQALLGGLLLAGFLSGGQGVAVYGGVVGALVLGRRILRWWPGVAAAGGVYFLWYLAYRGEGTAEPDLAGALLRVPWLALQVLVHGVANTLSIPFGWGAVVTAAAAAALAWLAWQRRLGIFEGILVATLATYLGLVVITRVAAGTAQAEAIRYAYAITFMLVPVFVPHLRIRTTALAWALAVAVVVAFGIPNLADLEERLDFWEGREQGSRQVVETAALLIAAGEPYVPNAAVDSPRAGPLIADGVARLVADGWRPAGSTDPDVLAEARGNLRLNIRPAGAIRGRPPETDAPVDESGCVTFVEGESVALAVRATGSVAVSGSAGQRLELVWADEHGTGLKVVPFTSRTGSTQYVTYPTPADAATLTVTAVDGDGTAVCGVTAG